MNDWEINKFLRTILTIQILVLSLSGLDLIGLNIPILKELIAFIYLIFVPGILILRVLRLHNLSNIETLLYTIGLSISSLMFLGFFINFLYPLFGISKPLTINYLLITITVFVLFLSILSYFIDKNFSAPDYIDSKDLTSPTSLFLCLIPFLAIFGTYLMNFYKINILLMVLIFIIAVMVILVAFDKIPKKLYPFLVFVTAISLLFHTSLISNYIWGWDINTEYYFASLVANNAHWNMHISGNVNAMLSITTLAPMLSKVTGMNLVWVFKIIYPALFALVPLGLYMVFKEQSNEKIAFLSTFFFMTIFTFFREMNQLCRQEIAEIFFLLLIMLMIDSKMNKTKRSILFITFAFSLIVSHYGLSYIYMGMLVIAISVIYLLQIDKLKLGILKAKNKLFKSNIQNYQVTQDKITTTFILLFIIFGVSWYMYVSGSSTFDTIVGIGNHILSSISTDLLNSGTSQGLTALNAEVNSPLHKIPKYLNLLFQCFIVLGILSTLKSLKKFKLEYVIFAFVSLFVLVLSIALPYFASSLNMTRVYHIVLFFLAPFAIIGGIYSFRILYKLLRRSWTEKQVNNSLRIISILLCVLFLFFTGFVYEVTQDDPTSFSLSKNVDYSVFDNQEVSSIKWLHLVKGNGLIYGDAYRYMITQGFEPFNETKMVSNTIYLPKNEYLFLGSYNIKKGTILVSTKNKTVTKQVYMSYDSLIFNKNKIYDSGNSLIYF
jgi:uncharacterized membrane protein